MELDKILFDYKASCKNNDKWYKENRPQYLKNAKIALIVTGCIALLMVLSTTFFMKSNSAKAIINAAAVAIMVVAVLCIQKYIQRNEMSEDDFDDDNKSSEKRFVTIKQYRCKQSESLKEILADNNIIRNSFDEADIQRIQMLIELIRKRKATTFGLKDLDLFLIRPTVICAVPAFLIFVDHLTSVWSIAVQLRFFLNLTGIVMILGIIFFMVSDSMKSFVGGKYDKLIDALENLLVFY